MNSALLREQTTYTAASQLPIEGFPWKFTQVILRAYPKNDTRSIAIGQ